jgi:hypothetical protein
MSKARPMLEDVFEHGQAVQAGIIPVPPPNRRAFISAPASVDTSVIRRALEVRGIAPYEIDDLAEAGASIPEILDDCLRRADLVVAVVGSGKSKDNVLFELGYATALKKKILALVPPNEDLPVSDIPYLRVDADNKEAIDFGLDQILNAPGAEFQSHKDHLRKTKPIGSLADKLLALIHAKEPLKEQDLEMIIRDVIGASGISSMSYPSEMMTSAVRVDMAIWSDDFEPWIGNPLVIEVKSQLRSRSELRDALGQLTKILDRTHTEWGMLIYQRADFVPGEEALRNSRVFIVTIEHLLESLRDTSLGDYLRRLRNMRVHGRG